MLAWLKKRFSTPSWDLSSLRDPWEDRPAIAAYLEALLDESAGRLPDSGVALPDDDRVAHAQGVRFAAGARDGIALFHIDSVAEPEVAGRIIGLLRAALADGGLVRLPELYAELARHRALSWIDDLGQGMALSPAPDPDRLYALGLHLVTCAPDREAVKAGIAMLALIDLSEEDLAALRLLGGHDEFTLYAAAIGAQSEDAEQELWAMAQRVTGWGRIHAVQRLADTENPEIQAWLLREGFHNDVMDRYLALVCAETGDLAQALEAPNLDPTLRDGATALLSALLEPAGPTPGMDAWEEGATAVTRWLDHVARDDGFPLSAVPVLARIAQAGRADPAPWPPEAATDLANRAHVLLAEPRWRQAVQRGLTDDDATFETAAAAAPFVGVDTFDAWLCRCTDQHVRPWARAAAAIEGQAARLDHVLRQACQALPADLTASEDGRGSAPTTVPSAVLSVLLQALPRHPGTAPERVIQGLRSPLAQHRNLALRTLVAWPHDQWPEGAHERVAQLTADDPEETVRTNAAAAWGATVDA